MASPTDPAPSRDEITAIVRVLGDPLAKELGPGKVRVDALSRGLVATEGTRDGGLLGGSFEQQVAAVAVFPASADARGVTGEVIAASGGA